ncbi:MAG TPA: nucleoside hydrolase [Nitrososphaera sp.]|nr:nucleoside hydrolase [Nitrososphaera sp.]
MDPGIDDAVALLLALNSPKLEIAAITTVSGNVGVRKVTRNALRLVQSMSSPVPVYMGASRPAGLGSGRPTRAESIHGRDGLGNSHLPKPERSAEKLNAVEMMAELLKSSRRKEISVVATGPLTNLAMLIMNEPSLARKLGGIYVMGGLYDPAARGNVTKYAEFNFYSDAPSADLVMRFACKTGTPVVASGLELTSRAECAVDSKSLQAICAIGSSPSNIACRILRWPVRIHSFFNLHDVFALFAMLHPDIFTTEKCSISVVHSGRFRGRCKVVVAAPHGGKNNNNNDNNNNIHVCKSVNTLKFNQLVLDGLR